MANTMTSQVAATKTMAELMAELDAANKQIALLQSANKLTIAVDSKRFGQGTISLSGLQRFPLSLHPAQWAELLTVAPGKIRDYMTNNSEHIRASAVAAETAIEVLKLDEVPAQNTPNRKAYEEKWQMAYDLAIKDSSIVPKNKKYRPVTDILAQWK